MSTIKQRQFVKRIVEGKTPTQSAFEVYKPKTRHEASVIAHTNLTSSTIKGLMDKVGFTEGKVVQRLNEALDAEKDTVIGSKVLTKPDYYIRLKSSELALRLWGYLGERTEKPQSPPQIKVQFIRVDGKGKKKYLKTV